MISGERKTLDFGSLDEFEPRQKTTPLPLERKAVDQATAFPSREREDEAQMNIRASGAVLNRFRQMAKGERYKLGAFLEILMNHYEQRANE
jgi:CHAD domain-containing protein